ncbi:MAG: acetoin utilization protein AcuC [Candidatus Methylomirabilales bacterium]
MAPAPRTALILSPRFWEFDYGPGHPLRTARLRLTAERCRALGLLARPETAILPPREATEEELAVFHDPAYLDVLRHAEDLAEPERLLAHGLGTGDNPVFPGVYDWARLYTGGSLVAMEAVDRGEVTCAFNIAGGLHHAMPARASGFCYVNDAAVVIRLLAARGRRVAYVDIDAHHGDGVQAAFYDTDQVLTISLHETGETLFPGTGRVEETGRGRGEGYAVNCPLAPGTDDAVFLWAFEAVVPPLLRAFGADVLVAQLGIDTHRNDPLTHMALTIHGFAQAVRRLRDLAPAWIALGGGGYHPETVARGWTVAWALMNHQEPPAGIAEPPDPAVQAPERHHAWRYAREQVRRLQDRVFPQHGLVPAA